MKFKLIIVFYISILVTLNTFSQTFFQGGIYSDTQWLKSNSPYIITGNVVVFPGKILTIDPGVEVKFDGNYFLEIRGILQSIGSNGSRIIYTSNASNPQKGDWVGIKIKNEQGAKASFEYSDFIYSENASSVECCWDGGPIYYKNCTFENNHFAMTGYTGYEIIIDSCKFTNNTSCISHADKKITNSIFIENSYGIDSTERVSISNSTFNNNEVAIFGGRGLIENCIISGNEIAVKAYNEGFEIRNNVIENNGKGLILSSYDGNYPPVKNNTICNNDLNVINTDDINKDLTSNCWCTSDSAAIEDKLIDGYDDITLGLFNYDIYNDSCETKLKTIEKVDMATGIYKSALNSIVNIYPVPFRVDLNLDFKSTGTHKNSISIYNIYGQEVYNDVHHNNHVNLNLENLNAGVYVCFIKTGAIVIKKKLIKI